VYSGITKHSISIVFSNDNPSSKKHQGTREQRRIVAVHSFGLLDFVGDFHSLDLFGN
jgi:hypothetical protein